MTTKKNVETTEPWFDPVVATQNEPDRRTSDDQVGAQATSVPSEAFVSGYNAGRFGDGSYDVQQAWKTFRLYGGADDGKEVMNRVELRGLRRVFEAAAKCVRWQEQHDTFKCIHEVPNYECGACAGEPPHFPVGIDEFTALAGAVRDQGLRPNSATGVSRCVRCGALPRDVGPYCEGAPDGHNPAHDFQPVSPVDELAAAYASVADDAHRDRATSATAEPVCRCTGSSHEVDCAFLLARAPYGRCTRCTTVLTLPPLFAGGGESAICGDCYRHAERPSDAPPVCRLVTNGEGDAEIRIGAAGWIVTAEEVEAAQDFVDAVAHEIRRSDYAPAVETIAPPEEANAPVFQWGAPDSGICQCSDCAAKDRSHRVDVWPFMVSHPAARAKGEPTATLEYGGVRVMLPLTFLHVLRGVVIDPQSSYGASLNVLASALHEIERRMWKEAKTRREAEQKRGDGT